MRATRALTLAATLAGCAQGGLPLQPTVGVPAARFDAVQGQAEIVVRTHLDDAGQTREVGGAVCEVSSILFSARLTTPARFVFPSFGPQSPTLVFDCRAGQLEGRAEQSVVSRFVRYPGAWPGPGPWAWGWGWPYGYGGFGGPWGVPASPAYVAFVYPDVSVRLR